MLQKAKFSKKNVHRPRFSALYIVFQELVKTITEKDKNLGYLLLRTYKRLVQENEMSWMHMIEDLATRF